MLKKIITLAFIMLYSLAINSGCSNNHVHNMNPVNPSENGVIDLSLWHPIQDGAISLDGEWTFYWQQLIDPDEFMEGTHIPSTIKVPGLWNRYKENHNFWPGDGFATFRLRIQNLPELSDAYYLLIPEMPTASRLWVNGTSQYQEGTIGKNSTETVPFVGSKVIRVLPSTDALDLVLQVANFTHKDGGIWHSFKLGTHDQIFKVKEFPALFDMFIFGTLFIMGMYHLGLFALRTKDRAALYFGLFCLLIAGRSLMVGQRLLFRIIETQSWILCQKIEYAFFFMSAPAFILFFYHLFPKALPKMFCRIFTSLSFIFVMITFFLPLRIVTYSGNLPAA